MALHFRLSGLLCFNTLLGRYTSLCCDQEFHSSHIVQRKAHTKFSQRIFFSFLNGWPLKMCDRISRLSSMLREVVCQAKSARMKFQKLWPGFREKTIENESLHHSCTYDRSWWWYQSMGTEFVVFLKCWGKCGSIPNWKT